jgi:hypothetical protein
MLYDLNSVCFTIQDFAMQLALTLRKPIAAFKHFDYQMYHPPLQHPPSEPPPEDEMSIALLLLPVDEYDAK